MNKRERFLAMIVAGFLAVLINAVLINFFLKNHRRLNEELARKSNDLRTMQMLFAEKPLWEQSDAWLTAHQPRMTNEARAGSDLLGQMQDVAKKYTVLISYQTITQLHRHAHCAT